MQGRTCQSKFVLCDFVCGFAKLGIFYLEMLCITDQIGRSQGSLNLK